MGNVFPMVTESFVTKQTASRVKLSLIKVLHAREAMKVENDIVAAIICIKLALNDFDHSVRVCHEDPFMLTGSAKTVTGKDTN